MKQVNLRVICDGSPMEVRNTRYAVGILLVIKIKKKEGEEKKEEVDRGRVCYSLRLHNNKKCAPTRLPIFRSLMCTNE